MDALITILTITALFIVLAGASLLFGSDSRDGFADDRMRPNLR